MDSSVYVTESQNIADRSSDLTITLNLTSPVTWNGNVHATYDPIAQKFVIILNVNPEINNQAPATTNGDYPAASRDISPSSGGISPLDLTPRD